MDEEQMAELGLSVEDRNFYRDPRVSTKFVEIPRNPNTKWHWIICTVCEGHAKHVNPSIDASGLTHEDFAEDPDFAEDYMSGAYDVPCTKCHGGRMVVIDEDHEGQGDYEDIEQMIDFPGNYDPSFDTFRNLGGDQEAQNYIFETLGKKQDWILPPEAADSIHTGEWQLLETKYFKASTWTINKWQINPEAIGLTLSDGSVMQFLLLMKEGTFHEDMITNFDDVPPSENGCTNPGGHEFKCSGTAYDGDDPTYHGEGRCYCIHCGEDGDS